MGEAVRKKAEDERHRNDQSQEVDRDEPTCDSQRAFDERMESVRRCFWWMVHSGIMQGTSRAES